MSPRKTTPESRQACARHAVSELLAWDWPADLSADANWTPSPQQVAAKTNALYSWVAITLEEAQAAIDQVVAENAGRVTEPKTCGKCGSTTPVILTAYDGTGLLVSVCAKPCAKPVGNDTPVTEKLTDTKPDREYRKDDYVSWTSPLPLAGTIRWIAGSNARIAVDGHRGRPVAVPLADLTLITAAQEEDAS